MAVAVKVYYGFEVNASLGGVMFYKGVAEFADKEAGIKFAEMYRKEYFVIE